MWASARSDPKASCTEWTSSVGSHLNVHLGQHVVHGGHRGGGVPAARGELDVAVGAHDHNVSLVEAVHQVTARLQYSLDERLGQGGQGGTAAAGQGSALGSECCQGVVVEGSELGNRVQSKCRCRPLLQHVALGSCACVIAFEGFKAVVR